MVGLSIAQRGEITASYRLVRQAFHDAEKAVRNHSSDEFIEIAQAHALANNLINVLRKHLGIV